MNKTERPPIEGGRKRQGDWMITSTGRRIYPLDAAGSDFSIVDIAHHLARICRYGGAVDGWYSVAEHCCLMSDHFAAAGQSDFARWALLHDAAEAFIGDMIRPLKRQIPAFGEIEAPLEIAIWQFFGLGDRMPPEVKTADTLIIDDERVALFPLANLLRADWMAATTGLGVVLQQWERDRAALEFIARFCDLFNRVDA